MTSQKNLILCSLAVIFILSNTGIPTLSLGADKHTQVGYGVDTSATVDITVVTKSDQPVSNAIVQLKSPGAFETTYRTDEDGYFTAMIPCRTNDNKPITHEVVVTHDDYKTATGTFTTGKDSCDQTSEVTFALDTK